MAVSGMSRMLGAFGLDPEELKASVEAFMAHMQAQAEKINANQARIESMLRDQQTQLSRIANYFTGSVERMTSGLSVNQGTSTPIYENGQHTGVIITDEKFPDALYQAGLVEQQAQGGQVNGEAIGGQRDADRQGGH